MRIFIDEAGDYGWSPPQISLHCAVIVPNASLLDLYRGQLSWQQGITGKTKTAEIKASGLSEEQLLAFVQEVIGPEPRLKLVLMGMDTRLVAKSQLESWRDAVSTLVRAAGTWSGARGLTPANRQYEEMSGWLWNRSPENLATLFCLGEAIWEALQYSIIWFHEPEFETEFEDFEIIIDRSFIKEQTHEMFWREFLRNHLQNLSRRQPLAAPEEWKERNHAFERRFSDGDTKLDMGPLFRDRMYFADSKKTEGLQIADTLAQVCLRYHRREEPYPAYAGLQGMRTIVGRNGPGMTALVPTGEFDLGNATGATETQQQVIEEARRLRPRKRRR